MANFNTQARAVDLLGKEQIRDEATAIAELLKNAYDADATYGKVEVDTTSDEIYIWDDGIGMSYDDLENNWLTLGTYSKKRKVDLYTDKGRAKIGEKGIGRLAISILGSQLLIISKSKKKKGWSLLFLHWDLFKNENFLLNEVNIPIKHFDSKENLLKFIKNEKSITELKSDLKSNLDYEEKWSSNKEIHSKQIRLEIDESLQSINDKITNALDNFKISNRLISLVNSIDKNSAGTIFYISDLESNINWKHYYVDYKSDYIKNKKHRLQSVAFAFSNVIAEYLGLRKDDELEKYKFDVEITIDKEKLHVEEWFNQEDLELYDYSLIGKIENGRFHGTLDIKNTEKFIIKKDQGIPVTHGIENHKKYDCGPVEIAWFFVEGDKKNTNLSDDQHDMIIDKLIKLGGIYVYRNNLRVLPYGEVGNDFLELERRRSLRASTYLFNHRRIFGYMEISKEGNPKLLDKSSREGFVEDDYYNYFKQSAINLLIWWAREYLGTTKKDSRRDKYIKNIEKRKEQEKRRQAQMRKEKERENNHLKEIKKKISNLNSEIERIDKEFTEKEIYNQFHEKIRKVQNNYFKANKYLTDLQKEKSVILTQINNCYRNITINKNPRYNYSNDIEEQINSYNKIIEENRSKKYNKINELYKSGLSTLFSTLFSRTLTSYILQG